MGLRRSRSHLSGPLIDSRARVPGRFSRPVGGGECDRVDIAPTLLEAAGVPAPSGWKGRSLLPLLNDPQARQGWSNQQLIQISESMTGRAIRTRDWTYCVADPSGSTKEPPSRSVLCRAVVAVRSDKVPAKLVGEIENNVWVHRGLVRCSIHLSRVRRVRHSSRQCGCHRTLEESPSAIHVPWHIPPKRYL